MPGRSPLQIWPPDAMESGALHVTKKIVLRSRPVVFTVFLIAALAFAGLTLYGMWWLRALPNPTIPRYTATWSACTTMVLCLLIAFGTLRRIRHQLYQLLIGVLFLVVFAMALGLIVDSVFAWRYVLRTNTSDTLRLVACLAFGPALSIMVLRWVNDWCYPNRPNRA